MFYFCHKHDEEVIVKCTELIVSDVMHIIQVKVSVNQSLKEIALITPNIHMMKS